MRSNKDLILVLSECILLEYSKLVLGETIVDYCRSEDILATKHRSLQCHCHEINGPRQANLVLIAYASSEGSGEPAHPRSLARTFAARSYKQ